MDFTDTKGLATGLTLLLTFVGILARGWLHVWRHLEKPPSAGVISQRAEFLEAAALLDNVGEPAWAAEYRLHGNRLLARRLARYEVYRQRRSRAYVEATGVAAYGGTLAIAVVVIVWTSGPTSILAWIGLVLLVVCLTCLIWWLATQPSFRRDVEAITARKRLWNMAAPRP